jgi:hypothetical protein
MNMDVWNNIEFKCSATICVTNHNNSLGWFNETTLITLENFNLKSLYLKLISSCKEAMLHRLKKCKALNPKAWKVVDLKTT